MSIWWIKGLPDDGRVKAWIAPDGRMQLSTQGSINMSGSLQGRLPGGQLFLPGPVPRGETPQLLVNEISNAETHANALRSARGLCRALPCPVINDPEKVLRTTRDRVSAMLQDREGLNVPRVFLCRPRDPGHVFRLADELELAFPLLIRRAGTHGGESMLRLQDAGDAGLLDQLPFDGRDFYLGEYVDYRSPDGLYRKYRFVVVDGEPFPRHLLISPDWMVHASAAAEMEHHPEWLDEEAAALAAFETELKPRVASALGAIDAALGLDYWGVDCALGDDGRLVVFEANCNMNVPPNTRSDKSRLQPFIDRIVDRFEAMLRERMREAP